jgi:hypothetical protein
VLERVEGAGAYRVEAKVIEVRPPVWASCPERLDREKEN